MLAAAVPVIMLLLSVIGGSPSPVLAADASAVTQQTATHGTPPSDLAGRWLAVGWLDFADGRSRTVAALWEVAPGDEGLKLTVRQALLPEVQTRALAETNRVGARWEPAPSDLDAIAQRWDGLEPVVDGLPSEIRTSITTADAFDDALRNEPEAGGARWVLDQTAVFPPRPASLAQEERLYAVRERHDAGYAGRVKIVAYAMAPMPLPITFRGTFQLYRLGTPGRSLLSRIADVFRGCRGR